MKLWFFTLKNENRYGETISMITGVVKAETSDEAETIIDRRYGSSYSYGLTIDEIKDDEPIYACSVNKHIFS